ncbi:ion channel [Pirellulaceae bacterium SH501]
MPSSAKTEPIIPVVRNTIEVAAILGWWWIALSLVSSNMLSESWMSLVIVVTCLLKTAFFGTENVVQLRTAARNNIPHHRFLIWMAINMGQMIMSFAFDFHCLYRLNADSFAGIASNIDPNEALFDCFYLSTLNFSFFGYSDILPQTVAAKIVNLTEILIAFVTVIFLLSDFMSLKESISQRK